ncbi:MAG: 4-chlorobenzoate--CoA ligase [Actinomycetia bacterium]|nr:4-chlorobenzoate--CoA ligase [Actinomycetes bacterium]
MNLAASLEGAAARTPEREALAHGDLRLTYAQLLDQTTRLAGGLAELGLKRGDRLAAVLMNRHECVRLYWATQWLGAVFVPLSWRASRDDVDYCIADAQATLVATEDGDGSVAVSGTAFGDLLGADAHPGGLDLDERSPSLMLYTSGTTGRPKGVPRSHRADRAGGISQVLQHGLQFGDRTLGVMPLYHTMGMHSLLAMSVSGGCFVCQPRWDPEEALWLIESERLTSLYLAPTLFHDLVTHPASRATDVSSVEALAYAGAAMTSALVQRCVAAFAPRMFVNHYGSTEIYTFSVHRDQAAKPGCAGRASLNAQLRLVRPGSSPSDEVASGEEGEIVCRLDSDEAFQGYWHRPDADEKAIRDGWYYTGDMGRVDEDGDLWVVGRTDDMIISGGENIHPLEVEDVLARHDRVREVAVVGAPDDRWGHRVVAFVVAEPGTTAEELDAHCLADESLARFKRPREYRFVEDLPKSPAGKILRRMLRGEEVTA